VVAPTPMRPAMDIVKPSIPLPRQLQFGRSANACPRLVKTVLFWLPYADGAVTLDSRHDGPPLQDLLAKDSLLVAE